MKNYLEFNSKISSAGGTSSSYKTTIPKAIIDKLELNKGDKITWKLYDNSNKVEIIFKNPFQEKKQKEEIKKENYTRYIKGSKNKGYYIVNEEKNINLGAYIEKSTAKYNLDLLLKNNWNNQTINIAKINIEHEVTEHDFPYVRNNKPYRLIQEDEYNSLNKDVLDETAFKNISYDELQSIIKDSLEYKE